METKRIVLDNEVFHIQQFTAMKALKIEKKIMAVLVPILGGLFSGDSEMDLDSNLDFSNLSTGFQEGFGNLKDEEFEALVLDCLSSTMVEEKSQPPEIINITIFDRVFIGKLLTVYKLIFEVMKFNRFSFFDLVGGGNVMGIIDGLKKEKKDKKEKIKS